jgi:hypothetical protein
MSRYEDALEVLSSGREIISSFEQEYELARSSSKLANMPRVEVKSAVECIRSALEFTAQDIWHSYTRKEHRVYFPYGKTKVAFDKSVKKNLPALEAQSPNLYSLVEALQPYACGDSWLEDLCVVSNFNKHKGLSTQIRKNSLGNAVSLGGMISVRNCADVTFNNVWIEDMPLGVHGSLVISNIPDFPIIGGQLSHGSLMTKEFDWVEFHIDLSDNDVLKLLSKSYVESVRFVESAYALIGKQ